MRLSILLAFKCRMLRKCRDWHDLLNFGDSHHLNFNLPIMTSFPLVKSCLVFVFGLNFRMKHEDSMKTSLRPSILLPASRLVNWLLLMVLMRPMQAVQPARDCYSSTSGHLEPKVGWTTNTGHVFFSSWSINKKITARFIWRSDSDLPVISQKIPEWIFRNHFSQKRPDTWYISHFWTANQKLWTEEQEATQWEMGLGILETANCALVHLARWKNHRVFPIFSDFPRRVLRIIARTLHFGKEPFWLVFSSKEHWEILFRI